MSLHDTICYELSDLKPTAHFTRGAEHHARKGVKVVYLGLKWVDDVSFFIPDEDLVRCAQFIHRARTDGGLC